MPEFLSTDDQFFKLKHLLEQAMQDQSGDIKWAMASSMAIRWSFGDVVRIDIYDGYQLVAPIDEESFDLWTPRGNLSGTTDMTADWAIAYLRQKATAFLQKTGGAKASVFRKTEKD
jgi:hypothetical protein